MSVEHKFFKQIVVSPLPGQASLSTVLLQNTLVTNVDIVTLSVAVNGQIIQRRTNEPVRTFAKYYYEVINNNTPYNNSPTIVGVDTLCNVTINVYANSDFAGPGYDAPTTHQQVQFSDTDNIFISFYHTVVRDA